jgi:hypothetical protein
MQQPSHDQPVLVAIQPIGASGRRIAAGSDPAALLSSRIDDVRRGFEAGVEAMGSGLTSVDAPAGWDIASVEAKFGLTLGAEGSIIVSSISAAASFEVTITFERNS